MDEEQPKFRKDYEKFDYRNKLDQAMGLIALHVFDSLLFHIEGCETPKQVWDKYKELFGKVSEFWLCK